MSDVSTGFTGSAAPAPTGAEPSVSSSQDTNVSAGSQNEPTPIEIDENAYIKIKGQDKPIKFGEYGRNFQSQWTKAAQRAKALEAELARERAERQKYEAAQRNPQTPSRDQSAELTETLKTLPYLSGEQAAKVIGDVVGQIKQRDAILLGALKQMEKMQRVMNQLYQNHTSSSFESKISKWLEEGGYPKEAAKLAKMVYLAHEGDDLDQEFPRIFKEVWDENQRVLESQRVAKLNAARKERFVPGKGGNVGPSKPLQFKGHETARDVADTLWKEFNGTET